MTFDADQAIADTRRWVDRAVIGLQLCPFAKAVQAKGQVHYAVHPGDDLDQLAERLLAEAQALRGTPANVRDTTLLIVPDALQDFYDFHDFTGRCERLMRRAGHEGELQLASFHPRFQFAGAGEDDIGNASNRSPHPTLHLLREASIDRAVEAFPDAAEIFEHNIDTLESLGAGGWMALDVGAGAGGRP
ncbi:DUF1415 domain-containing protein [Pseudacidovorax sp. RU35E]|uniref:DUF1415 domain-containing protein n=1 Tax=Pseudacidovorax sp. RU35E TaxID=1907403 RepID=UPI00095436A3|nr:DUF1415 domain-containing protein [Pseudacidovorax sp. RU35E]SIR17752.1 hypothetical protein SAMN05880557_108161 [Pseudacidovorax sp. RU35E]